MLIAILTLFLLLLLPDLYVYLTLLLPATRNRWWRMLYWLPALLLLGTLIFIVCSNHFTRMGTGLLGDFFYIFLLYCAPKIGYSLFSFIGWCFKPLSRIPYRVMSGLGVVTALLFLFILIYGRFEGYRHFQVNEITYTSPRLPRAFDGYRIVQFSDLHLGGDESQKPFVEKLVQLINAQRGDLIVFTGDLVNTQYKELLPCEQILSQLHAPDGVWSIMGNHDYGGYRQWDNEVQEADNLQKMKEGEGKMGWHLLLNQNSLLHRGDTCIALVGVENDGEPPFPAKGDLKRAQEGLSHQFKVLLSHDPTHWRRAVLPKTDIDLTLSGHTHGMQLAFGRFSPASWRYRESMGLYHEGRRALYVNVGCGNLLFPFRFGAWPEISIITLRCP